MDTCILRRCNVDTCILWRCNVDTCILRRCNVDTCILWRCNVDTCILWRCNVDTCILWRCNVDPCVADCAVHSAPMEHSIVSDFENLQVLASCDFHKMDRMVQDLTNALEETERPPPRSSDNPAVHARGGGSAAAKKHVSASKKHRCKKRKSTQNIWECGNLGEASESSLDEAFRDYMESVPHGSDSDEFALTVNRLQLLASFANTALSLAESDSFNETLSPMRAQAQRRRRKLKRMAVDPHPDAAIYGDKCCHLKEKLTHSRRLAAGDASSGGGDRSTVHGSLDTLPGKRKRGMRDKGGNSYEVEREGEEASGGGDDAHMECSNNNE